MSQTEKAELWSLLKENGVEFDEHYRNYSTEDLKRMLLQVRLSNPDSTPPPPEEVEPQAGSRAYTPGNGEEIIRVDENGFRWLQDEVKKPAFPAPRKRRKLTYIDPGVQTQTAVNGKFIETFETAGSEVKTGEVKITMPSYQVGIYIDPRFPFKVHTYNGTRGFDLHDVFQYYGGADLVPAGIKKLYVGNDLCFDITTTVRAIRAEYRDLTLKGSI